MNKRILFLSLFVLITFLSFAQYKIGTGYITMKSEVPSDIAFSYKHLRIYPLIGGSEFQKAHKDIGKFTNLEDAIRENKVKIFEVGAEIQTGENQQDSANNDILIEGAQVQTGQEIEQNVEQELLDIILKYPPFYFYDLIGDLIGLTDETKLQILEESSAFKDLSLEIEKKLEREEKEDKFIELATLGRIIDKIRKDFEFKSYKELQVQAMPVRMIKRKIFEFNLDRFPISIPGLKIFKEANFLKIELIKRIERALKERINYDQFEQKILDFLKSELYKQLKTNPNDFIYFLQNLNESNFTEIIYLLNKYGIYNI